MAEDVIKLTRMMTGRFEAFAGLSPEQRQSLYFNFVVPHEVAQQMARHVEELDLNYSKSPICHGHGHFGSGPRPGEQAPDAGPLMREGRGTSLYEIMRGTKHTLLLFAGAHHQSHSWRRLAEVADWIDSSTGGEINVWLAASDSEHVASELRPLMVSDPEGSLHRRYGADCECLHLIRPDGCIGYRGAPASCGAVREYLDRVLTF